VTSATFRPVRSCGILQRPRRHYRLPAAAARPRVHPHRRLDRHTRASRPRTRPRPIPCGLVAPITAANRSSTATPVQHFLGPAMNGADQHAPWPPWLASPPVTVAPRPQPARRATVHPRGGLVPARAVSFPHQRLVAEAAEAALHHRKASSRRAAGGPVQFPSKVRLQLCCPRLPVRPCARQPAWSSRSGPFATAARPRGEMDSWPERNSRSPLARPDAAPSLGPDSVQIGMSQFWRRCGTLSGLVQRTVYSPRSIWGSEGPLKNGGHTTP